MSLLERIQRAQQLVEEIGLDVSLSGEDALDELQTILCDMRSALTAQAEEVKALREALSGLVNLNENPPPDEPRRGVLANMAWTQARAALAQAAPEVKP